MIRAAALVLFLALPAGARPVAYDLQAAQSTAGFEVDFGGQILRGDIPVLAADLVLDFETLANCRIDVTLDAGRAQANLPFATEALKGASVLDAAAFPAMVFHSDSVTAAGQGARVTGTLTLRGVTRPIVLEAVIWRQKGTAEGDLSRLTVRLTGSLRRSDFGATGFAGLVADRVHLVITARLRRHD